MTFDDFKAFAGTGKRFAIVASSSNSLVYPKWFSFATGGYPETLTTSQLFVLENSTTGEGWYNIKRVSDNQYVSTEGGNFANSPKMDFKLVNRRAGDYASEFSETNLHVSLDNAAGNHYNANTSNLGFRAGTGGYSTYITYGPFYIATINCIDSETEESLGTWENAIVRGGTTPSFSGYELTTDPTSGNGITADGEYEFKYTKVRYAINFSKEDKYHDNRTDDDRWIEAVGIRITNQDDQLLETGFTTCAATTNYKDLTSGTKLTVKVGQTVTPIWRQKTNAMNGWVYIDLNNDGDFEDEGEQVSNTSSPWTSVTTSSLSTSSSFEIPNVTAGDYHIRYNVAWSGDPKGYNDILAHGGSITDAIITIEENETAVENTYEYYLGDRLITSYTHIDDIGAQPTGAISLPSYVTCTNTTAPDICGEEPATFRYYTQETGLPFKTDGTYYNLALNRNPNLQIYATEGVTNEIQTRNVEKTAQTKDYYMWSFEGDWYNGYAIKNRAADKYISYGTTANPNDKTKATLVDEKQIGSYFNLTINNSRNYFYIHGTTNNAYISNNGGAGTRYLTNWNSANNIGDAGAQVIITEVLVEAGFYRIKGNTSGKYLAAGLAANNKFAMTDATDATTIFYYDGVKLTNLSSGMCNGVTSSAWAWTVYTSASDVTFHDGHTNGGYGIQTATVYFYDNGDGTSSADRGANADMTTGDSRYRSWSLEPVTSLPFEIEANSYKSFSAPVAITIPGNCKAYIAKTKNNNTIKMEEVTGNVPANTGLVIGSGETTNLSFDIYTGNDLADCSGDLLECNIAAAELSRDENYFFGKQKSTGNYIFTKLSGTGDNYTLYGFKSYLPAANLPAAVDARIAVVWDYDDPTGLNELKDDSMEVKDGKYYQNQKIVVIRNGVKYNVAGQIIK